jgi:2-keto-3-deoxy-6-phosphogluconate aldolase
MVPVTGGATFSTKPVEMSMPDNADMPCCPGCADHDNSKSAVACGLKCVNFFAAVLPATVVPHLYLVDAAPPSFVNHALHGHASSPPTHPPPV